MVLITLQAVSEDKAKEAGDRWLQAGGGVKQVCSYLCGILYFAGAVDSSTTIAIAYIYTTRSLQSL